ncbi:MAG: hypothetical protein KDB22_05315 [Planctomycetales bacterium]|nr:hypothetical protein [Planctomycetales bacterium]
MLLNSSAQLYAQSSLGTSSGTLSFSTRSVRGSDPLQVKAELFLPGYALIGNSQVTITCPKGPSKADRNLEVVLYTASSSGGALAYHQRVLLAEGSSSVQLIIPHQLDGDYNRQYGVWSVKVFENGRSIDDKNGLPAGVSSRFAMIGRTTQNVSSLYACILASSETESVTGQLVNALTPQVQINNSMGFGGRGYAAAGYGGGGYGGGGYGVGNANVQVNVATVRLSEASNDWRQYLPYSYWFLSMNALREAVETQPEVARALTEYVAAGGRLVVHSAWEAEDRQLIEKLLFGDQLQLTRSYSWASLRTPVAPWWQIDARRKSQTVVVAPSGQENNAPGTTRQPDSADNEATIDVGGLRNDLAIAAETWVKASFGSYWDTYLDIGDVLGDVDALDYYVQDRRDQLLKAVATDEVSQLNYLNGRVLISRKSFHELPAGLKDEATEFDGQEIGMVAGEEFDGNWSWRNLITAVGKPPVWTFCFAVAMFGLLLGPGLLFFTAWLGRRSLMIFFVPLLALVATFAIIGYGILHEGFQTHIRTVSVQSIDPGTGNGFVWSRQSYFSGLPPKSGLPFRSNTYVRPVHPEGQQSSYPRYDDPSKYVGSDILLGDAQVWQGWLRPRQHQQLLVGHPVDSAPAVLAMSKLESGELRTKNLTNATMLTVVIRGADEDYYYFADLKAGETVDLPAIDVSLVESNIARAMSDIKPQAPPELDSGGSLLGFVRQSNVVGGEELDVINHAFRKHMSDQLDIEPFGFAVLQKESDLVEIPIEGLRGDNLHLVVGVQPW